MYRPLADELRPATLDEIVGQTHILGENGLLRRIVETGNIPNMVFYGPPGTGKTTVANIIAGMSGRALHKLNATTASLSDIKAIVSELDTLLTPNGVLIYLDEIQYFNKKQQQSLLEFIENGKITLIASTTENPYFYVYGAILSRSSVFEFRQITAEDVSRAIDRAIRFLSERDSVSILAEDTVIPFISEACGGDVRRALNLIEVIYGASRRENGIVRLAAADAELAAHKTGARYDRGGDETYDMASALMKSLRGSDPDAALHYLARFIEAGDIITPVRRILCSASEDIGLADPRAMTVAVSAAEIAERVGLPEARLALAEAVIYLATAPKSNSVVMAIDNAIADVKAGKTGHIPRELQNVHADGTGFEREQGYLYPHDFPNHWVEQRYLPHELGDTRYYEFGENKNEQAAKSYWEKIKSKQ